MLQPAKKTTPQSARKLKYFLIMLVIYKVKHYRYRKSSAKVNRMKKSLGFPRDLFLILLYLLYQRFLESQRYLYPFYDTLTQKEALILFD